MKRSFFKAQTRSHPHFHFCFGTKQSFLRGHFWGLVKCQPLFLGLYTPSLILPTSCHVGRPSWFVFFIQLMFHLLSLCYVPLALLSAQRMSAVNKTKPLPHAAYVLKEPKAGWASKASRESHDPGGVRIYTQHPTIPMRFPLPCMAMYLNHKDLITVFYFITF